MATRLNLKKYIAIDGRWRFVPVLKHAAMRSACLSQAKLPTQSETTIQNVHILRVKEQPVSTFAAGLLQDSNITQPLNGCRGRWKTELDPTDGVLNREDRVCLSELVDKKC